MAMKSLRENVNTYVIILLSLIGGAYCLTQSARPILTVSVLSVGVAATTSLLLRGMGFRLLVLALNVALAFALSLILLSYVLQIHAASDIYRVPIAVMSARGWFIGIVIVSGILSLVFSFVIDAWIAESPATITATDWLGHLAIFFLLSGSCLLLLRLIYYLTGYDWSYTAGLLGAAAIIAVVVYLIRSGKVSVTRHYLMRKPFELQMFVGSPLFIMALARCAILAILWTPILPWLSSSGRAYAYLAICSYAVLEIFVILYRVRGAIKALKLTSYLFGSNSEYHRFPNDRFR